jgi:mannose-6-phosphate isomerase-like protein (cupin superfamily)
MRLFVALLTVVFISIVVHAQTPGRSAAPARGQAAAPARPPKPVTTALFFDKEKVAATFAKGGNLVSAPDMIVLGSHREVAGGVEVHDKETDVIYVIDGGATFVTGGAMEGGKATRPGQWLGTSITGGETHKLTKGDMIIVPAGMPHWFREMSPQISYYVVKVVKP